MFYFNVSDIQEHSFTNAIWKIYSKKFCKLQDYFIKLKAQDLQLYQNRETGTGALLWILWNFSEQLYEEQLWTAAPGL